jgi:phosphohistidine phosphatase SixA
MVLEKFTILFKTLFLMVFFFTIPLNAYSNDSLKILLNDGGKLIFIRHAYAPGVGDPINFDISDCSTQRNLNDKGIVQAINIGNFFSINNIKIDKVLTSEWCRCKETAKYVFNNYETKSFLNSFFSQMFSHNKDKQIKELKDYIINWEGKKNLILVTHYVVILEVLNLSTMPAEIIVADKNFNVLAKQKFTNN